MQQNAHPLKKQNHKDNNHNAEKYQSLQRQKPAQHHATPHQAIQGKSTMRKTPLFSRAKSMGLPHTSATVQVTPKSAYPHGTLQHMSSSHPPLLPRASNIF